jgi:MYXO-CTERM domain-containing protein
MTTEPASREPRLVVGPLALVSVVALWRGIRRRSLFSAVVGIVAAITEFGSSDYRRFKRRWTVFSLTDD